MSMREMGAPTAPMPLVKLSGAPGAPAAPGAGQQLEVHSFDESFSDIGEGLDSSEDEAPVFKKNLRDPEDVGGIPSNIPRRCTDVNWMFGYFAFSALVVAISVYVWPLGAPQALLKLTDWQGDKCGLGDKWDKPHLFFCPSAHDPERLQMWYPICVSTCPQGEAVVCPKNLNQETTTTSTTRTTANFYGSIRDARNGGLPYPPYPLPSVYQRYRSQHSFSDQPYLQPVPNYPPPIYPPGPPAGPWEGTPWRRDPLQDPGDTATAAPASDLRQLEVFPNTVVYSDWRGNFTMHQIKSYTSAPFVDMVCKPWVYKLKVQVQEWIDETPLVNFWATLINSYWPLLVDAGMGVVMSYVFMTLLRFRAAILVKAGMVLLTLGPLITGLYYIYAWRRGNGEIWGSTGAKFTDGVVGFTGIFTGLTLCTITYRLQEATDLAVECIEWSCKAVLETPSLKLEPVMALSTRIVVDLACVAVISMILTSELEKEVIHNHNGQQHWIIPCQSEKQLAMLAAVGFWGLWTNMIITAISDFVIMYTAELWVFAGGLSRSGGHAPLCCLLRGYYTCLRYHFGSMVIGGLVVGFCQPFRLALGVIAFVLQFQGCSCSLLTCCCDWLVDMYFDHFEPWCRNAYMDLALNGQPFVKSALHASLVNAEFMTTVNILNGATWVFQLAGLGAITSLGHMQTCVIIRYYPGFTDPFSGDFVQNPLFLSILGSVVAFVMAFPFMMIFDTVSDTILFAYIVQKIREEKDETPTIYSRACGFVETVDDYIGLGCLDRRKKDYSMPKLFQDEDPPDEDLAAGVPSMAPSDPLSMTMP